MRLESSVTAISWIPSEAVRGVGRLPFSVGLAHYDEPPPERLEGASIPHALEDLRRADGFRIAHHLAAWVDADHGAIRGYGQNGGGVVGSTTLDLGSDVTVAAAPYEDLRPEPEVGEGWVRFRQSAGGRTGVPAPRHVNRPPFVQITAPTAWTTLELTVHADGRAEADLVGASPFPRHWVYDHDGDLVQKTGMTDFKSWYRRAFGAHSPWGGEDSAAVVAQVETALERQLSTSIMRSGARPTVRRLKAGRRLVDEHAPGDELYLLLDGVLGVEVGGERLAELGPGAIVGERAALEGGRRTSTLVAITNCRVAVAEAADLDRDALVELGDHHRREDDPESPARPA